jgi:hypothetical protein
MLKQKFLWKAHPRWRLKAPAKAGDKTITSFTKVVEDYAALSYQWL